MIIGEAMALRAFLHFDMLRLFGPVYATNKADLSIPYNTVYSISATSLLPATQVVEKVLKDLDEAERLLGESDPIIEEGPQNQDSEDGLNYYTYRTQRLNYYAVKALKARVYLWADNKAEAYREAKAVTAVQEQWFPWTKRREIMDIIMHVKRFLRIISVPLWSLHKCIHLKNISMIYLLGICWIGVTDRFGWKALPGTTGVSISMKTCRRLRYGLS